MFVLRFLLQLTCQPVMAESSATFSVVEMNAFKHLNHLSLRLLQGSDREVKDYLAARLSSLKVGLFSFVMLTKAGAIMGVMGGGGAAADSRGPLTQTDPDRQEGDAAAGEKKPSAESVTGKWSKPPGPAD